MYQCPICGAYMNFNMGYNGGIPYTYNTCSCCGYDSRNYRAVASTTTSTSNVQIRSSSSTITSSRLYSVDRIFEHSNEKTIFSNADSVFG